MGRMGFDLDIVYVEQKLSHKQNPYISLSLKSKGIICDSY